MSKSTGEPLYAESLEQLFKELDTAKAGNDHPIFKKFDDKEHYETRLMFAVRKRQAAKYHMDNMIESLTQAAAEAKKHAAASKKKKLASAAKFTMSVTRPSGDCAHELVAFFAALRSGLDFLTMAACRSLPGTTAHSIHTLMTGLAESVERLSRRNRPPLGHPATSFRLEDLSQQQNIDRSIACGRAHEHSKIYA